jgi:hypothetical protein
MPGMENHWLSQRGLNKDAHHVTVAAPSAAANPVVSYVQLLLE